MRVVRANCSAGDCTISCNPDEIVLIAFCGTTRAPASFADEQRATCRTRGTRTSYIIAACAQVAAAPATPPTPPSGAAKRPPSHHSSNGVPNFDLATTCRGSSDVMGATPGTCLADEQSARAELAKGWNGYPAAERARCSELAGMPGFQSYVELLTCLDMAAQAKALNKSD